MHFWSTTIQFSFKDTKKQVDIFLTGSPHTFNSLVASRVIDAASQ